MPEINKEDDIVDNLLFDITGKEGPVEKETLQQTITDLLSNYNLNTSSDFVEKVAKLKFNNNGKTETYTIQALPAELKDAAFLPVNTIADIALRQDLDMVISQIPEWFTALTVTRDAVCEADVVTGELARNITYDKEALDESEQGTIIKTIEEVEERLELHQLIKNHCTFNTLEYGEGYLYAIPYAKVFSDLYKYRLSNGVHNGSQSPNRNVNDMFDTTTIMSGYGYSEAAEITLKDTLIAEAVQEKKRKAEAEAAEAKSGKGKGKMYKRDTGIYTEQDVSISDEIFTEAEVMNIFPLGDLKSLDEKEVTDEVRESLKKKAYSEHVSKVDEFMSEITSNIRYVNSDIALPIFEQSANDLRAVYEVKYKEMKDKQNHKYTEPVESLFEQVMTGEEEMDPTERQFKSIKGIYLRVLPATKLIPIRLDKTIIGYYYISDLTRPEVSGQRRNSGLSGYTLRTPSVGYDTFSPDQMFCEKLATKIINNFNLKFMHDNTALHKEIVSILQQHKFNEAMLRFVFIPAEHVIQFTINKDGLGKGHSMLEPGLVTARMYMFLKLYSILYQINNSSVRVYNVHTSGMDKNYRAFVNSIMEKFAARRITANDIFNYRTSITKVSGGSELIMPEGAGGKAPITFETIDAANAPINNDLLDNLKNEAINATPVPSMMVQGAMSEVDFAKEVETANTRFNTMVAGMKLDINPDLTKMYRKILKYETDLDENVIKTLKVTLRMPMSKTLSITSDMLSNFNSLCDLAMETFLTKDEQKEKEGEAEHKGGVMREYKKLLLHEYFPLLDVERLEEMADEARQKANPNVLKKTKPEENMVSDVANSEEEMMM